MKKKENINEKEIQDKFAELNKEHLEIMNQFNYLVEERKQIE